MLSQCPMFLPAPPFRRWQLSILTTIKMGQTMSFGLSQLDVEELVQHSNGACAQGNRLGGAPARDECSPFDPHSHIYIKCS